MKIKLYQINQDRDVEGLCFLSQDALARRGQEPRLIDSEIYDLVYRGDVEGNDPEEVFLLFNNQPPEGYQGRAMTVSDVLVISQDDGTEWPCFCDSIGFTDVIFDQERAHDPAGKITVVLLEPGREARVTQIHSSLSAMQKVVGGYIEACYPFEEEVCLVCNEEGKLIGLPPNRAIYGEPETPEGRGRIVDIVAGTCFLCDCSGEDFGSLTEEQQKKYVEMFRLPQRFARIQGEFIAIPYTPGRTDQER